MTELVVLSLEVWDAVWRRNQHLVAGLLRRDPSLRVLFVEPAADPLHALASGRSPGRGRGLRREPTTERLWLLEPTKWLPRRTDPGADRRLADVVRRAARRLGMGHPVLWVNDPAGAAVLALTGWPALYDVTDDWVAARRTPAEHDRLLRDEGVLLDRCAEVVVCSPHLARTKGAVRPVTLVPNAVDTAGYTGPVARPADLPPAPVAVYVGTVHRDRIDVELCAEVARALGPGGLALVGPAPLPPADLDLLTHAGAVLLGPRDRRDVPAYLRHADVLVVPHVVDDFTDSLDPIKLYEYAAARRPVVSTPVAGFRDSTDPLVTVTDRDGFARAVLATTEAVRVVDPWGHSPCDGVALGVPTWRERTEQMAEVVARVAGGS
ncbi:glycosyltransferase [Georgenia sp. M64]|uniref:glycosyltransferase n=1 Tax=Georgenia sp. M64 TaxID=3120520 RepID=UPI0030E532B2